MNDQKTSPVPHSPVVAEKPFNFKVALDKMIEGKSIQKLEWKEKGTKDFGYISKITGQLHIVRDGKDHQWILSEGDILGEDFVVIK